MMKKLMFAALVGAVALPANATLIVNGSFETPDAVVSYYSAGSTAITGFTVVALPGGGDIQLTDNSAFGGVGAVASNGTQYLDLTGNIGRGGGIQTDAFQTTLGQSYIAAFDLGAFFIAGYGSYGDVTVDVYRNGIFAQSFTKAQTLTSAGTDYARYSYSFAGTGTATTLAFYSSQAPTSSNLGVAFDNLTVDSVDSVPEPSAWLMMLAGFGLIGFGLRSRRAAGKDMIA